MRNTQIPLLEARVDMGDFKNEVNRMEPTLNGFHIVKVLYLKPMGKRLMVWHPIFDEFLADHQLNGQIR